MPDESPVSQYEKHRRRGRRMADLALRLTVAAFGRPLVAGRAGRVAWDSGEGVPLGEVSYLVGAPAGGLPTVLVWYTAGGGRPVETRIRLTDSRTRFGGRRLWLVCPHVREGGACGRRIGTLYLPDGEAFFACRGCHDLTYYSSRRAHQLERLRERIERAGAPERLVAGADLLEIQDAVRRGLFNSRPSGEGR